jgi:excisionase family DNA binding protein
MQDLLDTRDVCQKLKMSPKTVQRLRKAGDLRWVRLAGGRVRFTPDQVTEYVSQHQVQGMAVA